MDRKKYRETKDYKKALTTVNDFVYDALDNKIENLKNKDIKLLIKKIDDKQKRKLYYGKIDDPDMYYITQAIYIVVWGHIYNLTFDKLGSWGTKSKRPFRGDTINSFNSIFGKNNIIANRYKLNYKETEQIDDYSHLYHSIGNFIVIPNKGNLNRKRANYYSIQDYFDSFIGALYIYKNQSHLTEYDAFYKELKNVFVINKSFDEISFDDFIDLFYLEDYVLNGKPCNVFNISYEVRKKEYIGRNIRSSKEYINTDDYKKLICNYYVNSRIIINNRANHIVNELKKELVN